MAEIKTKATEVTVESFIAAVPDPVRRADAEVLLALYERLTGEPAKMWGPTIVGFGSYRYQYESGHGGEMCRAGFSPRKAELVLYVLGGEQDDLLARLGKHRRGKGCLYVKKLADVDMGVLETLVRDQIARMDQTYPRESA
jgi:hypothetical protein